MPNNVDDMTAADRPRKRWLVATVALIVPLVVIVGAAAWFVRTYVMPPNVAISPLTFTPAPADRAVTTTAAATPEMPAEPQTTGSAPPAVATAEQPQFRYTTNSAEVWAAVPLPGPPRPTNVPMPEPALTTSSIEPTTEPVPLPPRRPRIADRDTSGVPLPRPRPALAAN